VQTTTVLSTRNPANQVERLLAAVSDENIVYLGRHTIPLHPLDQILAEQTVTFRRSAAPGVWCRTYAHASSNSRTRNISRRRQPPQKMMSGASSAGELADDRAAMWLDQQQMPPSRELDVRLNRRRNMHCLLVFGISLFMVGNLQI
jgi:hypothetical protein